MTEQQDILGDLAGRRITAVWIGEVLGVTEKTARKRLADGLTSDDVIALCRAADVNPVVALVEMNHLTIREAMDFLDQDGTLLANATQEQLIYRLAEDSLPLSDRIAMGAAAKEKLDRVDELAQRRSRTGLSEVPVNVPIAAHRGEVGIETPMSDGEGPQVDPNEDDNFEHP
ncbi:immunity repressor [Gordonia phage Finkle]|uniref:Immunity repressor n=1 Tax=Gordonia phage Finkle TaxID=2926099 RepID=A0A9E7T0S8_9CAUD|nr:immunity repressor [Gordonia phage Finkle]UTN92962.1 immunity repressor [Gordonia phage Finkle]